MDHDAGETGQSTPWRVAIEVEFQVQQLLDLFNTLLAYSHLLKIERITRAGGQNGVCEKILRVYRPLDRQHLLTVLDDAEWRIGHLRSLVATTDQSAW